MHLTVAKSNLIRLLQLAQTFKDREPPKPILRNALLSVVEAGEHQLLRVTASDLMQTLTVHAPCEAEQLGSVALSAKALADVVGTLPEGPVELSLDGARVKVGGGRRAARIPFEFAEDFPRMPEPDPTVLSATIDASLLVSLIERVRRCASQDTTRPDVNSVLIEIGGGIARGIACATGTLAMSTGTYDGDRGRVAVVPLKAATRLLTALEKYTGPVLLTFSASSNPAAAELLVQFGSVQFATKRGDRDRYPPVEQALAEEKPHAFTVATKALASACDAGVKVLDNGEVAKAIFDLAGGELSVSVSSSSGRAYTDVIADVEHEAPLRWAMNLDLIAAAILPIGSDLVQIRYADPLRGFVFSPAGDDSYVSMVSPCHL